MNGPLLASIVDLGRYPIDRIESDAYGSLVSRCRADLVSTGAAQLPGFLRSEALEAVRAEALAAAPHGFPNDAHANVYFTDEDTSLPQSHPNRRPVRSAQKAVAMDLLPDTFGTKVAYRSEELTRFAADVLGVDKLYPSADPLDGCNMTVFRRT